MKTYIPLAVLRQARLHRNLQSAMALGLILTILVTLAGWRYNAICDNVCRDTLRLHILANSDSAADQALKLNVRDAILGEISDVVAGAATKQQAVEQVRAALPRLRQTAQNELAARHSSQTVSVRLEQWDFAAQDYGRFALPGGRYTALRIELGAAKGHNWFCVLYPELCVGTASGSYVGKDENALVFGKYQVRLALLDAARDAWEKEKSELATQNQTETLLQQAAKKQPPAQAQPKFYQPTAAATAETAWQK